MKRIIAVLCVIPLLLSGCTGWLDGSYQSVTPHLGSSEPVSTENLSASDYSGLQDALLRLVMSGLQKGVISVAGYPPNDLAQDMEAAIDHTLTQEPLAAYAAIGISYEMGTAAGQPAVAVTVLYRHDRTEVQSVLTVPSMFFAQEAIAIALNQCDTSVALYVTDYTETDIVKWIQEYANLHPNKVVECPTVTVNHYPATGDQRVLELTFTYKTGIRAMQSMQQTLKQLFEAAVLSVSGTDAPNHKFNQLYGFLAGRFDYQISSSITPAYSLLVSGIGDAKAFASVYAAMCTEAGLECYMVSGTKAGQSWYWNIININGLYYHVDLIQCLENGVFRTAKESEMTDYTWDVLPIPSVTNNP